MSRIFQKKRTISDNTEQMMSIKNNAELILTCAWQQKSTWLKSLRPLSKLYGVVSAHQKNAYQLGKKPQYIAPIPVLVIGNITIGGSGKTPLLIQVVNYLSQKNIRVGVISRGYGGDKTPRMVSQDSLPSQVGDEPCLIVQKTQVAMAVAKKRQEAIELLLYHHPDIQMIISDDGLQHHALYRDDEWIVVDTMRGFGNQKLFPEGFLREPISRLDNAKVIYHQKNQDNDNTNKASVYLSPSPPRPLIDKSATTLAPQVVHAMTGIGYPQRFFDTLSDLGYRPKPQPFPDHHSFVLEDINPLQDLPIVVTAKDAVKLITLYHNTQSKHLFDNIWVLDVTMVLSAVVYEWIDEFVALFVDK